jgi:hypothetical protein
MDYSFIRESFNIDTIAKSILSIQISPDGFSFVISPNENPKQPDYIYIKRIIESEENLAQVLTAFSGFDLMEFYAIRIIVHDSYFALVPESIFDLRDMKAYLNMNHPPLIKRKTLSNNIPPAGAVVVFSMDETIYKLLKKKYPGADFCHSALPFCSMVLNKTIDGCFVQVYENSLEMAIVKDKKLFLYNIYEIQEGNDIVYFVLNAYKSVNFNPLSHPLYIAGVLPKTSETIKLIGNYIKDIRFYVTDFVVIPEKGEFEYPSHYFLNHREILNCEL